MKARALIIAALVLSLAVAGSAIAMGPMGKGMGMGMGMCPMMGGATPANLTPEQAAKYQAFQKDTAPQREKIAKLHQEMWNLRAQATPDWNAINAKHQEIFQLKTELMQKAQAAGVAGYGMGMRGGMGMHRMMY
ncbi:MAG TPA: periplasmic heavy metal sensor [Dissulfurispiraceae bacterium]|nr:periplasmic heavy metal sensor [Dissulfurispiraceae bacterium]